MEAHQSATIPNDPEAEHASGTLGACIYVAGGQWKCQQATQSECAALGGTWYQGKTCQEVLPIKG
jgi:hypothetical protein